MRTAQIITVTKTSDFIEEETYYQIAFDNFTTIEGKPYIKDVTSEEHFEKVSVTIDKFFRKLFNEAEKAIRHCKSRKMEDYTVWYDFLKKAINYYFVCSKECEDLPDIPKILIEYLDNLSFMDVEIKGGRIIKMGVEDKYGE